METKMFRKTLRYGKGYSGKMSNKCWVARITGSDNKYGLSRDFIEADEVEREHFNRPRTMIDFTWNLPVGLYEFSEGGDRCFIVVWVKNGEHTFLQPDDERVKAMVKLMDEGVSAEDARIATKKPTQTVNKV